MIYTDGIHMVADSYDELHEYANSIKLKRCWYKHHWRHPHYDIVNKNHEPLKQHTFIMSDDRVKKVSSKEIVKICRVVYCFPTNEEELEAWNRFHVPELFAEESVKMDFENLLDIKKNENIKSVRVLSTDEERALQGGNHISD